jgi:TPP-dependent pyruvate/acetoin dehydrogenase alpha subunit
VATQHAAAGAFEGLDAGLDLYRRMLLIRRFEELVQSLFLRGEVYGTTHLCSGQEAVSVGFASALGEDDRTCWRAGWRRRRCSASCSAAPPASTAAARGR